MITSIACMDVTIQNKQSGSLDVGNLVGSLQSPSMTRAKAKIADLHVLVPGTLVDLSIEIRSRT